MTIILQTNLSDMEPTQKYETIISAIDLHRIYHEVMKKSNVGAPGELNYAAMIILIFIQYVERISTIKDLVKRLKHDMTFKSDCGFLVSEVMPSESCLV